MSEASLVAQVVIVGGGAAGLMAAIAAASAWRDSTGSKPLNAVDPVILLEKLDRVGKKLLTTGNGRCNLSNESTDLTHYHGQDPDFAKPALTSFSVSQTLAFFREIGLPCRTEEKGKIFPYSLQASAVLDILRQTAERLGVRTLTGFAVSRIARSGSGGGYRLSAGDGRQVDAARVIVATGGLAAPGMGCDGSGYALMERFGHKRTELFPALVQIRTETSLVRGLAGIKFDGTARAVCGGSILGEAEGEILFTEYGLSGPPMLDLSRVVAETLMHAGQPAVNILLDFLPDMKKSELNAWLTYRQQIDPNLELSEYLTGLIIKKLGQALLKRLLDGRATLASPVSLLTSDDISRLAELLKSLPIRAVGTRDWTQAQVTAGGLSTDGFSAESLESRMAAGLYAAGEILDIDGDCGGFNLQWAWSSGWISGHHAMQACLKEIRR